MGCGKLAFHARSAVLNGVEVGAVARSVQDIYYVPGKEASPIFESVALASCIKCSDQCKP